MARQRARDVGSGGFGEDEGAPAVFVDGAGRLRLGGVWRRGEHHLALTRLDASGSIDRSVAERGKVLVDPSERGHAQPSAWAVAPDDDLVVPGSDGAGGSGYYLARFRAGGDLDRSFGEDGLLHFALPDSSLAFHRAIQPKGRILTLSRIDTGSLITPSPLGRQGPPVRAGRARADRAQPCWAGLAADPARRADPGRRDTKPPRLGARSHARHRRLLPDGSPDRALGDDGRAAMPIAFPHAEVVIGAARLTPRGNVIHDRFGDEPGSGMSLAALHRDGRFRSASARAASSTQAATMRQAPPTGSSSMAAWSWSAPPSATCGRRATCSAHADRARRGGSDLPEQAATPRPLLES